MALNTREMNGFRTDCEARGGDLVCLVPLVYLDCSAANKRNQRDQTDLRTKKTASASSLMPHNNAPCRPEKVACPFPILTHSFWPHNLS